MVVSAPISGALEQVHSHGHNHRPGLLTRNLPFLLRGEDSNDRSPKMTSLKTCCVTIKRLRRSSVVASRKKSWHVREDN